MTSRLTELAVDCHDPATLARFWCAALGFRIIDESTDIVEIASWEPTVDEVRLRQMPPTILFIRVPESKDRKNRLHIDISPVDLSQPDEVRRLLELGGRRVDVGQRADCGWDVLQDPEGNEFCVLRSIAPAAAAG